MTSYVPPALRVSGVSRHTATGRVRNELRIFLFQLKEKVIGARLQNTTLLRLIDRITGLLGSPGEITSTVRRLIDKLLTRLAPSFRASFPF